MTLQAELQSDFASMLSDFGISTTVATKTVSAIRNSQDKDIVYTELGNKSVEYRFTLWYDISDFTAQSISVPAVHDTISVGGTSYLVAKVTTDPVSALVALDMVEQYG